LSLTMTRLQLAWRHWRTCRPSCDRSNGAPRRLRWINADGFRVCRFCWAVEDLPVRSTVEKLGPLSMAEKIQPPF